MSNEATPVRQKSIKVNLILNVILQSSAVFFPLITFPYVSRVLTPVGTGRVDFAQSVISYFVMFTMLGVPTYGTRACARVRDDKMKLSKTVQELLIINCTLAVFAYLSLFVMIAFIPRFLEERDCILLMSTSIAFNAIGATWFFSAIEDYQYITIRSLICRVIALIVVFAFIRTKEDYLIYALSLLITSSGSYILNFLRLRKYITFKKVGKYNFKVHLAAVAIFFAMAVSTTIYVHLDTVMLGFMKSNSEVGIYSAAVKFKQVLVSLITALGTVLLPRLSYYVQNCQEREFLRLVKKAFRIVVYVSVPIVVFFIFFSETSILIFSGADYVSAVPAMQIIMPTVFFIGISNITGIQILVPKGKETVVLLSEIVGAVVDLILNFIFIPRYGAAGAAFGTLIAELSVLIVQMLYIKDIAKFALLGMFNWKVYLSTVGSFVFVFFFSKWIVTPWLLVNLAIWAAAYGLVYLALTALLKEKTLYEDFYPVIGQLAAKVWKKD